ncbi:MAG: BamA/TamA family outer membrane protein [bacterium]
MIKKLLTANVLVFVLPALTLFAQDAPDSAAMGQFGVSAATRQLRISAYPYVYYTPETEVAFGVGGILTFYTGQDRILRPSKILLSGYYATTGQYKITLGPQLYFTKNRYFVSTTLDFGYYVDKFYGIGNNTPEIDNARYASQAFGVELDFELPSLLKISLRSGIIYDFSDNTITDKKSNPYLLSGEVPGSAGGLTSGLGLTWVWDSRDHTFFPNRGGLHRVKAIYYFEEIGSDFDFDKYEVDLRQYFALAPDHVLAVQAYGSFARAFPPFYELPALGGQNRMRGYFQGRYRDKNYVTGQVEYRTPVWWRIGAVAFWGLGDVSAKTRDLKLRDFKHSYGAGLRVKFNQAEKVNLRVDFGFGKSTSGVYFGIEEAF